MVRGLTNSFALIDLTSVQAERPSQKSLHTMLLVAFVRAGGLDALFSLCREFINTIEMVSKVKVDERTETTKQEL